MIFLSYPEELKKQLFEQSLMIGGNIQLTYILKSKGLPEAVIKSVFEVIRETALDIYNFEKEEATLKKEEFNNASLYLSRYSIIDIEKHILIFVHSPYGTSKPIEIH